MRFRHDEDLGEPLAFEFTDGSAVDGADVDFGSAPRGGRPRRGVAIAVALAVAIGAGAVRLGRDDEPTAVAPAPTLVESPTPTSAAPVPVSSAPPTSLAGPRAAGTYVALPAFATDPGYGVWLTSYVGSGAVYRFDLTTGEFPRLNLESGDVYGVLPVADKPNHSILLNWNYGGFSAPVGDGTAWYFDSHDLVRHQLIDPDVELERRPYAPSGSFGFGGLNGVTADGRPTVLRADGRTYVVAADGSMPRFAEGVVETVDRGRYVEQLCSVDGVCSTVLHGGVGGSLDLGVVEDYETVSFSPDGQSAMVRSARRGRWSLIDLTGSGTVTELAALGRSERVDYGPTSASIGWSRDSRYFFFMANGLCVFDRTTGEARRIAGGPDADHSIIGVA